MKHLHTVHLTAIAFLLFLSCTKQNHWAFDQVHSDRKEFRSTKLTYYSRDPVHGIDLEFLNTEEHLNLYLNIHSIPVAAPKADTNNTPLRIDIQGETLRCSAYRLAGGQRFLVPDEVAQTVIKALQDRKEVSISLIGYRSVFKPEGFASQFEKLLHPFLMKNPFHLPI